MIRDFIFYSSRPSQVQTTSWTPWGSLSASEVPAATTPCSCSPTNGLQPWTSLSLSLTLSRSSKEIGIVGGNKIEISIVWKILVRTNTEVVWRTISDFQKDPYTSGLSIFSKITDKILFRWVLSKNRITSMLTGQVKHDKSSYFQPCRGTTTRGRDGRTAAGLISYFWHFFRGFAVFLVVIIHNLVAKITSLWIGPFFHLQPFQPWDMPACFHMQEVFQSGLFNNTPFSFPSFLLVPLPSFWVWIPNQLLSQFFFWSEEC